MKRPRWTTVLVSDGPPDAAWVRVWHVKRRIGSRWMMGCRLCLRWPYDGNRDTRHQGHVYSLFGFRPTWDKAMKAATGHARFHARERMCA